ncbi:hypothetical protein KIH41_16240 [Litoribacter ruber]|nr:hypothetical protein [Litoribacter ruber]
MELYFKFVLFTFLFEDDADGFAEEDRFLLLSGQGLGFGVGDVGEAWAFLLAEFFPELPVANE